MFANRHHIWARVNDRLRFIQYLISIFPTLQKSHEEYLISMFSDTASRLAEGDKDVELSIKSQLSAKYYDTQDNKNIFYQAMFIMAYSYYETCINLINKELGAIKPIKGKDIVSSIIDNNKIYLTEMITEEKRFIYETVREFRNFIVHNNAVIPTDKQDAAIKKLVEQYSEIKYDNYEVYITDSQCIIDILAKEYNIKYIKAIFPSFLFCLVFRIQFKVSFIVFY